MWQTRRANGAIEGLVKRIRYGFFFLVFRALLQQCLAPLLGDEIQGVGDLQSSLGRKPVSPLPVQHDVLRLFHDCTCSGDGVLDTRAPGDAACTQILSAHDGRVVAGLAVFVERRAATRIEVGRVLENLECCVLPIAC